MTKQISDVSLYAIAQVVGNNTVALHTKIFLDTYYTRINQEYGNDVQTAMADAVEAVLIFKTALGEEE